MIVDASSGMVSSIVKGVLDKWSIWHADTGQDRLGHCGARLAAMARVMHDERRRIFMVLTLMSDHI